jgi:hypothetical protein
MYNRSISCVNTDDNTAVNFNAMYGGFIIDEIDGIYEIIANVNSTEYGATDGSHYNGTIVPARNIVITGRILNNYKARRDMLYKVFRPGSTGQFRYTEGDETKVIEYRMEHCKIPDEKAKIKTVEISLLCMDPYFSGVNDVIVNMASWISAFQFPHAFLNGGEEFGYKSNEVIKNIYNENGVNGIGMKITIGCIGVITNPKIYHVEQGEYIAIGTQSNPFVMDSGSKIVIDTTTGKKKVRKITNNVEIPVDEYLDPASEFIQLNTGNNSLRYAADDGEELMDVSISYKMRFLGV